jgi:hypothetical protein
MNKVLAFIRKEFLELLLPTIFALVAFEILLLVRSLMGSEQNFVIATHVAVVIGALVTGKSVLIADALPLFGWLRDKPLILSVLWKFLLYMSIVLLFQIIEELIPLWSKYDGFAGAASHLIDDIHWPRFWASHITLGIFIFFYSFSAALIGVIGRDRFYQIFFRG